MKNSTNCRSTIALAVKVINNRIVEGMGAVGADGRATGCTIFINCLGVDDCGKLFNVNIDTGTDTYEEALKITEKLSCNSLHYIRGIFFIDSDENYDVISMISPSFEPIRSDHVDFYTKQFSMCNHNKEELISRSEANPLNIDRKWEEMIPAIISMLDIPKIMERVSALPPGADSVKVSISGDLSDVNVFSTKRKKTMATVMLNDQYGSIKVVFFHDVFKVYESELSNDSKVTITGRLDVTESTAILIAEMVLT